MASIFTSKNPSSAALPESAPSSSSSSSVAAAVLPSSSSFLEVAAEVGTLLPRQTGQTSEASRTQQAFRQPGHKRFDLDAVKKNATRLADRTPAVLGNFDQQEPSVANKTKKSSGKNVKTPKAAKLPPWRVYRDQLTTPGLHPEPTYPYVPGYCFFGATALSLRLCLNAECRAPPAFHIGGLKPPALPAGWVLVLLGSQMS